MKLNKILTVFLVCNLSLLTHAQELDKKQQQIALIAAMTTNGDWKALKPELSSGLDQGLTVNQIKEELVHLYAYVGFPKSIMGLQTFLSVLDERKANGIIDNWGKEASPIDKAIPKYERGKNVLEKLTQKPLPETKPAYQQFSTEMDTFLKEHLFADIFERDVLTFQQRELITVSALMSLGDVEPMLRSHLRICTIQGYTKDQLEELVITLKPYLTRKQIKSAKKIITEL